MIIVFLHVLKYLNGLQFNALEMFLFFMQYCRQVTLDLLERAFTLNKTQHVRGYTAYQAILNRALAEGGQWKFTMNKLSMNRHNE